MTKADPKLLDYLPDHDMLVVQRRFLLDAYKKQREAAREHEERALADEGDARHGPSVSLPPATPPAAVSWPPQKQASTGESGGSGEKAVEPQHELPPMLYSFDSVYRYTRGINDISNPGIGYGEMTRETRWSRTGDTLTRVELAMRRTRTGRQEMDRAPKRDPK
jgi:hypothetical protein